MYYEGIDSTNLILYLLRMEPGYVLLMYLSKILGIGFWEFAIFFKCVLCIVSIHLINKYILDDINNNYDPKSLDYGIWINQTLPPTYIIKHEHPKKMFDPFFRFTRINE